MVVIRVTRQNLLRGRPRRYVRVNGKTDVGVLIKNKKEELEDTHKTTIFDIGECECVLI